MPVRTVIERGPKGKKAVAFAVDWPGWSRGAKTAELALETLELYRQRYRPVAASARMTKELDAAGAIEVIEDRVGPGSTDFWGISFAQSSVGQADALLEPSLPHSAQRIPRDGSRVGDAGQGPLGRDQQLRPRAPNAGKAHPALRHAVEGSRR